MSHKVIEKFLSEGFRQTAVDCEQKHAVYGQVSEVFGQKTPARHTIHNS